MVSVEQGIGQGLVTRNNNRPYLERTVVLFPYIPCQLDDGLHSLDLPLDLGIKILLFDFREAQEMDGTGVSRSSIFGNEWSEGLIDVFGQEGGVRRLEKTL
jgi:hypothetical protein